MGKERYHRITSPPKRKGSRHPLTFVRDPRREKGVRASEQQEPRLRELEDGAGSGSEAGYGLCEIWSRSRGRGGFRSQD
jgi:hypothetical protein